jgi:5'-methylthioadenosine phosphorylase
VSIGFIGGSGLYDVDGLSSVREVKLDTPFGAPSDVYVIGRIGEADVVFLPRHGRGHRLLPSELNHRANIYGLKMLGVERAVGISAVGSLREEIKPCDCVVVDQFFDRTRRTHEATFFGEGLAAHVAFADPVCPELADIVGSCAERCGATVHRGGTYVNMEGPAFSTRAESEFYRGCGFDVIGMTNLGEAKLCREAEICYTTLAMVTDYDCWKTDAESVSVDLVIQNLTRNAAMGKKVIREVAGNVPASRACACKDALATAIITQRDLVPPAAVEKLRPIVGRYFGKGTTAGGEA